MLPPRGALDRHAALLLEFFVSPTRVASFSVADWDLVVRAARSARLLGALRARLDREHALGSVPPEARAQLEGAWNVAAYRRQMVLREMHALAKVLYPLGVPMILLKGAAYIAQGLRCAEGRLPEDLDLMIPRERLDEAEQALLAAGWASEKTDPYDDHYYRAWSHELPPMRFPGHAIELDVHHTILPPTGRVRPDARALFETSVSIPASPFRALSPADQVLHASAHLFQDSDCTGRLRDLVDIDALLREHGASAGFWTALLAGATRHDLGRALWYATRYCSAWLDTPLPGEVASKVEGFGPIAAGRAAMDRLIREALPPHSPEREPALCTRLARFLLFARSMWLRMPPWLLAYHTLAKALRRIWRRPSASDDR